jgi:hypothetical protein
MVAMHSHTWSTTLLCTGSLVGLMFVASLPRHSPAPAPAVAAASTDSATVASEPAPPGAQQKAAPAGTAPELTVLPKPQSVVAGDDPQTVVIRGRNLGDGLTAKLDGTFESIAFGERSIVDATPTSFGLRAAFTQEGTYRLTVRNAGGARSNAVTIVVTAHGSK